VPLRLLVLTALLLPAFAQKGKDDAFRGLLAAFDRHAIVAVAESHRVEQDKEFLINLIDRPEFPAKANDIVIEFGTARFQTVLDDYIAGKGVAPSLLRRVWADTTVVTGLWEAPIYERFLAAVRERNRSLPRRQPLRVLACDPPIDWPRVNSATQHIGWTGIRSVSDLIEREVLARRRHALVVMGDAHVRRRDLHGQPTENAIAMVERKRPGSTFVVLTYLGQYRDWAVIEDHLTTQTAPILIPLAGTWLGALPNVPPQPPTRTLVGGGQVSAETVTISNPLPIEEAGDVMLYLGPRATLTRSRPPPERFSPNDLRELERRHQVLFGTPVVRIYFARAEP
jgi:hypothetical protein